MTSGELAESESNDLTTEEPGTDQEKRLQYLIGQSDIFAHFLARRVAAKKT